MTSLQITQPPQDELTKIKDALKAVNNDLKSQLKNTQDALGDIIDTRCKRLSDQIDDNLLSIDKLKLKQEKLEESDTKQTVLIDELLSADRLIHSNNEKTIRQIDEIQSRLDGSRIPQIKESSLETIRAQVTQTSATLAGDNGQMPYREIQSNLQNTKFLGQVLRWLLSVFGLGGVLGAGSLLLGVGKSPDLAPELRKLEGENIRLETRIKSLEESLRDIKADRRATIGSSK